MIALQNARLYRDLEQEKERIAEIQEDARRKLARDLHDGPTQSIGAIAMRVNFARRLVQRDPEKAGEELFKIEELARRTTKEIRQMLFTLRPLVLESEGLVEALRQLAEKTLENHEQNVIVEAKDNVVADMEVGKQGVIFFIVEEAVSNARKHARAKHIWVRLKKRSDVLQLEIEDDGVGFDVESVQANYEQRGSLGMINLYERTELVNGILKFDSKPGRGTRITVAIPMTNEAAEKLHRPGYVA
jgi:signal transduction histidine kinase